MNDIHQARGTVLPEAIMHMVDVGGKRVTRRRAVASGHIRVGEVAFQKIIDKALPKGDVLTLAEIAGITGAKKTADLIPLCHTLPLDSVTVHCVLQPPQTVTVYAQAVAHAKTGVEMEAVVAVQTALTTIWDLVKGTEPNLTISDIRLLVKEGGKSGLWLNPDGVPDWLVAQFSAHLSLAGVRAAVLVMSDRATQGVYQDKSGALIVSCLENEGATVVDHCVVPDDVLAITQTLTRLGHTHCPQLIVASGGTGPGQRDVTPEALHQICDRMLEGFGEMLRRESAAYTNTAWLSRMTAGMMGDTLIIALPGSPKAVTECWEIMQPCLARALTMIASQRGGKAA